MDLDRKMLARARLAVQEAVHSWIYDPNVRYIDFGWRERGGKLIRDELTIRVHVIEKYPSGPMLDAAIAEGKTRASIPDAIRGFPVDRPQGDYKLHPLFDGSWRQPVNQRACRVDPLQGGISISNAFWNIYGTLGGLVVDRETGKRMILSNWHVLAGDWQAQPGRPIYQPGRGDGGTYPDTVARLSRHAMSSGLDAAVAELTGSRQLINRQFDLGPVKGVDRPDLGMEVGKVGSPD